MDGQKRSAPLPIVGTSTGHSSRGSAAAAAPGDDGVGATSATAAAAAALGSAPYHSYVSSWQSGAVPASFSSSRAADGSGGGDAALMSRSLVLGVGSSFIAGHSAFRHAHPSATNLAARSPAASRASLEVSPAPLGALAPHGPAGPVLGLEPGLGLTIPPLAAADHRKSLDRAAAAAAAAAAVAAGDAATPSSVASEAAAAGSASQFGGAAAAAPPAGGSGKQSKVQADVIYGIINAVVGIPTMISFAAIVFTAPVYKPLLGQLARMSFFSAAVHQLVFTLKSSLPFAVGQPQDVGLIFLSAMATSIADIGAEVGLSEAEVVGTALLNMAVATTLVGMLTWLVARFKLATLVQYVPLPVVGGYLGYVGYFCLAAGIGLGTNTTIDSFSSWGHLATRDAMIKFAPTLAAALVLWLCMTRARSPWALPLTLAAVPAAFYAFLLATGTSLEQAQEAGYVLKPEGKSTQQFWELYELFNISDLRLDGVHLPAIARQLPKMAGLFFVVTFGSCLDVAAIQADMPCPIDFNGELATVGLSNVVVGLSGAGYTGSYIFSQTIFSMRAGVSTWWHGAIIAALEGAIFLLPFSVVQYLPTFFFGALLTVFGIEIAGDWLVRSYSKVSRAEYLLLLATFLAIMQLDLEQGVAAGIVMCTLFFTATYARANMAAVKVLPTRSAAVRSYAESHLLEALGGQLLATVALSGYVFFGSSVLMSDKVIALAQDMVEGRDEGPGAAGNDAAAAATAAAAADKRPAAAASNGTDRSPRRYLQRAASGGAAAAAALAGGGNPHALSDLRIASLAVVGQPLDVGCLSKLALDPERLALLRKQAPAFVILDFRRVLGVDATSAQTLSSLAMVLRRMGVELVLTRVTRQSIRRLLVAHGIIAPPAAAGGSSGGDGGQGGSSAAAAAASDVEQPLLQQQGEEEEEEGGHGDEEEGYCRVFDTLNAGAKYAEDRLLAMARASGLLQDSLSGLSLDQFFAMHCRDGLLAPSQGVDVQRVAAEVAKLGRQRRLAAGQALFGFGQVPDSFFLILKGVVSITVKPLGAGGGRHASRALPAQLDVMEVERSFSSGQGAVVGITDFVLRRLRSFQATATTDCTMVEVSRGALDVMVAEVPEVATALQAVLLRDACLSEVYAYDVLERAAVA